jgi:hypothetical protein
MPGRLPGLCLVMPGPWTPELVFTPPFRLECCERTTDRSVGKVFLPPPPASWGGGRRRQAGPVPLRVPLLDSLGQPRVDPLPLCRPPPSDWTGGLGGLRDGRNRPQAVRGRNPPLERLTARAVIFMATAYAWGRLPLTSGRPVRKIASA